MSEADKRAREQAKVEWDMRRFHKQPKVQKKRKRSSEDEDDNNDRLSESEEGASPKSGSPRSIEKSKHKDQRKKEERSKGASINESPRIHKQEKDSNLRVARPVSQKTDIRVEAPFLKAERVRPNRNTYSTQRSSN